MHITILADNAAIHHAREVVDAINATGTILIILIFLPPYSPDFMPCEELFSQSKNYIPQNDISLQDSPDPELMMMDSVLQITAVREQVPQTLCFVQPTSQKGLIIVYAW